jgi:hemerythrin-like domain-containing protein
MLASGAMVHSTARGITREVSTDSKAEEEASPAEDLMREHGVLKRILLIYGEAVRRIQVNEEVPPQALMDSAKIIRSFIEDYHEKLEEYFLFPRFRKARQLVDLVEILADQHRAGRRLTDTTLKLSTLKTFKNPQEQQNLTESLRLFVRMYNPHEAREDTVLFPAFRKLVSADEYGALGEDFEKREHVLFGDNGFEDMADRVAAIEKTLGIFDLAQFTPKE